MDESRCCNSCLLAHIRPMTITCCTCCFKDAPSNFQVVNNSQCSDVQICFMFTPIWEKRILFERSSCLLFPLLESKPPTRFGCFHEQNGELILTLSAYLVLYEYLLTYQNLKVSNPELEIENVFSWPMWVKQNTGKSGEENNWDEMSLCRSLLITLKSCGYVRVRSSILRSGLKRISLHTW